MHYSSFTAYIEHFTRSCESESKLEILPHLLRVDFYWPEGVEDSKMESVMFT